MKKLVRVIGVILCAAAGFAMPFGVMNISQVGSCGDIGEQVCPAGTGTDIGLLIGGAFALTIGAILTMGVGVFFSLAAAAVTLIVSGQGPVTKIIGVVLIVVPGLVLLIVGLTSRASTDKALDKARFKARARMVPAVVSSVRNTGMTINDNPRVVITVAYQLDDGTPATYERKSVVPRLAIPRPGDRATVWYDPTGPQVVMELGEPTPSAYPPDAYAAEMLNAMGMASAVGAANASGPTDSLPTAPFQNSEPEDSVPGAGAADLVAGLERLANLHHNGSLNEHEYTLAKQRLLNGA